MDYQALDKKSILEKSIYTNILDITDPAEQAREEMRLEERARDLGMLTIVKRTAASYRKLCMQEMRENRAEKKAVDPTDGVTSFTFNQAFLDKHPDAIACERLNCGAWIADDNGIYSQTSGGFDQIACRAPVTIIKRYLNHETGITQVELAWARNHIWNSTIIPKSMISSANKIVALSDYGIPVTSENAKQLVKYLSEIDILNDEDLHTELSTSKLGWFAKEKVFVPFDPVVTFDGDRSFRYLSSSIHEAGRFDVWLAHLKQLRSTRKLEINMMTAASFASVLLLHLNALPFVCDLWGDTEGGKTLTLMVAASIWGDPSENRYIGDFKTTDVALETRADLLNHLPMILDDTSKVNKRIGDNFEGFVYDLTSGKGKSRSNKELGARRENTWRNSILTTGERSLSSYVSQGGAINRIIEIQCSEHIYDNPRETAVIIRENYGFAGKMFVRAVLEMGIDQVKSIFDGFYQELAKDEKMQKQSTSMAVILTADKIAADRIFKDRIYIDIDCARELLTDKGDVSDGQRAYEFIVEKINMNSSRFDEEKSTEQWGVLDTEGDFQTAYLYPAALEQICKEGRFSRKAAESWMLRRGLIRQGKDGRLTVVKKICGLSKRMVAIRLSPDIPDKDGFMDASQLEDPVFT